MNRSTKPILIVFVVLILFSLACASSAGLTTATVPPPSSSDTPQPANTAENNSPTQVEQPTEAASPTPEIAATTDVPPTEDTSVNQAPTPTDEQISQCTVLQNLFVRSGPGTAYRPPITAIPAGGVLTAQGFNQEGVPGGSWVLIHDPDSGSDGWVSAGNEFVSCNFDLTTLPEVAVDPPPPPPPPGSVLGTLPEGSCFPETDYVCDVVITSASFIEFRLSKDDNVLGPDSGLSQVSFEVRQGSEDGSTVYQIIEKNPAYCIFGGNGPCNSWPTNKDYAPSWGAGGASVTDGTYFVEIYADVEDENGSQRIRWAANIEITLP